MIQNANYYCQLCLMQCKTKRERDKHMILRHGSINEATIEKPTLLQCIVDLSKRVDYLENKVCELQSGVGVNSVFKNPITIEEFLDSYNEKDDYKTWISEIEIEDDDLQHLFDNNREMCIVRLLDKQRENIPLLCLIENPNIIYKYEEGSWQVFENEEFKSFILILCQRILKKYINWKKEHHDIIVNNDDISELNIVYMNKVNGGSKKFDSCVKDIKKSFIENNKRSIKF